MLDPKNIGPGQEQYEKFTTMIRGAKSRYQYDYRHTDGELFSCVKPTLKECRAARDVQRHEKQVEALAAWMLGELD